MAKTTQKSSLSTESAIDKINSALAVYEDLASKNPDTIEYKQIVQALKDAVVYAGTV